MSCREHCEETVGRRAFENYTDVVKCDLSGPIIQGHSGLFPGTGIQIWSPELRRKTFRYVAGWYPCIGTTDVAPLQQHCVVGAMLGLGLRPHSDLSTLEMHFVYPRILFAFLLL